MTEHTGTLVRRRLIWDESRVLIGFMFNNSRKRVCFDEASVKHR